MDRATVSLYYTRNNSTRNFVTSCFDLFNPLTPIVAIWVQHYSYASCARPG